MEWVEAVRTWADLLGALAAIIAGIGAWLARSHSKEVKKIVQAMQSQQQSQTVQQQQYFGPVYQVQTVGEGQKPSPEQINLGEFPPGTEADPHKAEQGGASQ